MVTNLISSDVRLQTPFVLVTIANTTFGVYSKEAKNILGANVTNYKSIIATYPNFIKELTITKLNGQINTYTLSLVYAIRQGDDPNLLEKLFSKVKSDRKIQLSYGDLSVPSYIYREENALITNIRSDVNVRDSIITYTLSCVSSSQLMMAGTYTFPKYSKTKPSDVLKSIIYDSRYGLLDVFSGMRDKSLVDTKGLIAGDDKPTDIEAKVNISMFDYISYLVNCMTSLEDTRNSILDNHKYIFSVYDDVNNAFGGPYFKVQKVEQNISTYNSLESYEIDVGFPGKNNVLGFTINDNQTYSLYVDYAESILQSTRTYRINNDGVIEDIYSPRLATSPTLLKTTEADKTWWSQVTKFPITVTLQLRGLLRPAILMSYVHLNTLFYGRKHISSGYYIITKQVDTINASGFNTTLNLTRISGDGENVN